MPSLRERPRPVVQLEGVAGHDGAGDDATSPGAPATGLLSPTAAWRISYDRGVALERAMKLVVPGFLSFLIIANIYFSLENVWGRHPVVKLIILPILASLSVGIVAAGIIGFNSARATFWYWQQVEV